jgi:acetylornithine deacetylase/succinyl-diaminopimelate desuccinylase-like protein
VQNSPCIAHLRDYVALPSVNPMGREDIPAAIAGEARYAGHLREQLRGLGLDAELIGPSERPSVIAEVRVPGARETLVVASHLDTVPVDGMDGDPFDPRIAGDRLFGRGSCDTKAGMAAAVAALERLLRSGRRMTRNVILVGESDEEFASIGAHAIARELAGRQPLWVLATEPTELRVVTHHKGIAIVQLAAQGRACHSSAPQEGRNAIVALARGVLALDRLATELTSRTHPLLGSATCSVGQIGGGSAPNIVPERSWLKMDRRLLPGEDEAQIRAEIEHALAEGGAEDIAIERCAIEKGALGTPRDHPSVLACQRALKAIGRETELATAAFATDAGVFAEHGLPGIVLGPGSIARAHTASEYVEIDQVEAMTDLLETLFTAAEG